MSRLHAKVQLKSPGFSRKLSGVVVGLSLLLFGLMSYVKAHEVPHFAGDAHIGQSASASPPPSADKGLIYFYRKGRMLGAITHFSAYIGDTFLAEIHNNEYASMQVPARQLTITAAQPITGKHHLPTPGEWASLPGCGGLKWRRLALEPITDVQQCSASLQALETECGVSSTSTGGAGIRTTTINVPGCNAKLAGASHAGELLTMASFTARLPLQVEAGKTYYVRWSLSLTYHPLAYKMELMDPAKGSKEIKGTKLAKETDEGALGQLSKRPPTPELTAASTAPTAAASNAAPSAPVGASEIQEAARQGNRDKVQELLESNPELVATKDSNGRTPLHLAAWQGHRDAVELLLNHKSDVNARDKAGDTPLHLAAGHGAQETVELLLARGAEVNAEDELGMTPLHKAVSLNQLETAEVLLSHGADVNAKHKLAVTPLRMAKFNKNKKMVKLLKQNGGKE